jgi:hypothetical protein
MKFIFVCAYRRIEEQKICLILKLEIGKLAMYSYMLSTGVHFPPFLITVMTPYFCSSSLSCGEMKLTVSCSKSSVPLLAEIFYSNINETGKEHFRVLKYEGVSSLYLVYIPFLILFQSILFFVSGPHILCL